MLIMAVFLLPSLLIAEEKSSKSTKGIHLSTAFLIREMASLSKSSCETNSVVMDFRFAPYWYKPSLSPQFVRSRFLKLSAN